MPPLRARHLRPARAADRRRPAPHRRPPGCAGLHLQPTPGTDLALALGLLHIAVAEGLVDEAYVDARTAGFDAGRAPSLAAWWPERVERITGVPVAEHARGRARCSAAAGRGHRAHRRAAPSSTPRAPTPSPRSSTWPWRSGLPGRPGSGYGCLTGQGNGQGGREHGQKADQLPGYRQIDDPAARAHVAAVWGVDPDDLPGPGRSAYELLDALGTPGGPRALLVFGSNPVVSAPAAAHVDRPARRARPAGRRRLRAVGDGRAGRRGASRSTQWAEEDGTMTNLEGRVLLRRQARRPAAPGCAATWRSSPELAGRLGRRRVPDRARARCSTSCAGPARAAPPTTPASPTSGSTPRDGVFWPCPAPDHPGTPRLFLDRFATPDGRARFVARRAPARGRGARRRLPRLPDHRPRARAVPERRADPPGRRAGRGRAASRSSSSTPTWPSGWASPTATSVRVVEPARRGTRASPGSATRSARDTVFMPFHWREGARTCSPTPRSTRRRGCRSSRSAPCRAGAEIA